MRDVIYRVESVMRSGKIQGQSDNSFAASTRPTHSAREALRMLPVQKSTKTPSIRPLADAEGDVAAPPASFQVESVARVILFAPDGTPLKRKMGF